MKNKKDKMNFFKNKDLDSLKTKEKEKKIIYEEAFEVPIDDDDYPNVVCIKKLLQRERISLKQLDFKNDQERNNFKRALSLHKTMGEDRYLRWLEVLGYAEVRKFEKLDLGGDKIE